MFQQTDNRWIRGQQENNNLEAIVEQISATTSAVHRLDWADVVPGVESITGLFPLAYRGMAQGCMRQALDETRNMHTAPHLHSRLTESQLRDMYLESFIILGQLLERLMSSRDTQM